MKKRIFVRIIALAMAAALMSQSFMPVYAGADTSSDTNAEASEKSLTSTEEKKSSTVTESKAEAPAESSKAAETEQPKETAAARESSAVPAETEAASAETQKKSEQQTEKSKTDSSDTVSKVTISYEVSDPKGGTVSLSSETISLSDGSKAKGSTAKAKEGYSFSGWQLNGKSVSSDKTLVPDTPKADVTYTAVFDKKNSSVPMPAFKAEKTAGNGVTAAVYAEEGAFPEGTTVKVRSADRQDVIDASQDLYNDEKVVDAAAVDITFYSSDGAKLEPADDTMVHVSLKTADAVDGDSYEVVHVHESGSAETIHDVSYVNGRAASFSADSFTVYGIVGTVPKNLYTATYKFYDASNNLVSTQKVKKGDTLLSPEVPKTIALKSFTGWVTESGNIFSSFGTVGDIAADGKVINLYAKYAGAATLSYYDDLGNVVSSVDLGSSSKIDIDEFTPRIMSHEEELAAGECQYGWSFTPSGTEDITGTWDVTVVNDKISISSGSQTKEPDGQIIRVYPIIKKGYWVVYNSNGGTAFDDQFIEYNAADKKITTPTTVLKEGYVFNGWYKDKECTVPFDESQDISSSLTLYAGWKEAENTQYTVKYYIEYQKDTTVADPDDTSAWDYKFLATETRTGVTGGKASYDPNYIFVKPYSLDTKGYEVNTDKTVDVTIAPDGSSVYNVYYKCKKYTYTFTGRSRDKSGSTYPVIFPVGESQYYEISYTLKYTQDLKFVWDRMENDGVLTFMRENGYHFYSTEGDNDQLNPEYSSREQMGDVDRWYSMLKPGNNNSYYNYFLESLEGQVPAGKDKVGNVSLRGGSDSRIYYLELADSYNSYAYGCLFFYSRGDYPGFTLMPELSDGHYWENDNGNIYIWFRYHARWTDVNQLVDSNGSGINYWWADHPLNIYFIRNSYLLTFHTNSGPDVEINGSVPDNNAASILYQKNISSYPPSNYIENVTTRTDADGRTYTFEGWYNDATYKEKFDFNTTMPSYNLDVYAKWKPTTYVVTFDSNGGSKVDSATGIIYGNSVARPADPVYKDHIFLGWTLNKRPYSFSSPVNDDITLVAQWRSVKAYKVTYDLNGGSGSVKDSSSYYENAGATVLPADGVTAPPSKVFLGWKLLGTDNIYYPNSIVPMKLGGITLQAVWGGIDRTTKLIYDFNFGQFGIRDSGTSSDKISSLTNNSRIKLSDFSSFRSAPKGYKFTGWYLDAACKDGPYSEVMVDILKDNGNIVYAGWEKIKQPETETEETESETTTVTTKKTTPGNSGTKAVATGDDSNIVLQLMVMLMAGTVLIADAAVLRRKKQSGRK